MSCPNCGEKESRSPTGDWCNNCGWQSPCQCAGYNCKGCLEHINETRTQSGFKPLADNCCCGRLRSQQEVNQ